MLDKEKVRKIAKDYSAEVVKFLDPEKIILFGSYMNGTPHVESDIDIAVFISGLDNDSWYNARITLQNILWNRAFIDIEPHLIEEANDQSGFAKYIIRTGEIVYEWVIL